MMKAIGVFLQEQLLGMRWLNQLVGNLLQAIGVDLESRIGASVQFFIYDVIKKLVIHGLQRNQELTLLNSYHDQFGDPTDDAAAQPAAPQPAENQ